MMHSQTEVIISEGKQPMTDLRSAPGYEAVVRSEIEDLSRANRRVRAATTVALAAGVGFLVCVGLSVWIMLGEGVDLANAKALLLLGGAASFMGLGALDFRRHNKRLVSAITDRQQELTGGPPGDHSPSRLPPDPEDDQETASASRSSN